MVGREGELAKRRRHLDVGERVGERQPVGGEIVEAEVAVPRRLGEQLHARVGLGRELVRILAVASR